MTVLCAGMKRINNELRRTQNELTLLEDFASFAVYDIFHRKERKGRKDSLIGLYAIKHRVHYELRFVNEHERVSFADSFIPEHREKWQSIAIPVTVYETAATSRFRTRIFTDIVDQFASLFYSTDNKPQSSQRTQSRMEKLCALRVICCGVTLFPANDANGEMEC